MTEAIELSGEGGALVISVDGYERPEARLPEDANWLKCALEVTAGPFRGATTTSLATYEFVALAADLNTLIDGQVGSLHFEAIEQGIELEFSLTRLGSAKVDVTLRGAQRSKLQCRIECDRGRLQEFRRALEGVTTDFPIREASAKL